MPSNSPVTPTTAHPCAPGFPFHQRLRYTLKIRILQFFLNIGFQLLKLPGIRDKSILPTSTKIYPCQPKLKNRIFIPKSYRSEDGCLPLYIDIHGGGFALMHPLVDDEFCSDFSNKHNLLVISLDYPKSPTHRFPVAIEALVNLVNAVLSDPSLPIDETKVAIGGCSAGGNLALGVCQDASLQGKIGGVVAFYAPMDFSLDKAEKFEGLKGGGKVLPVGDMRMFSWAYVAEGQDLRDPKLSPIFAKRESLPRCVCVVGCEMDALCGEEEEMAIQMAGEEGAENDLVWEQNGVRWEKILGEDHGFDNIVAFGEKKRRMRKRGQEMRDAVAEWLFREVYI